MYGPHQQIPGQGGVVRGESFRSLTATCQLTSPSPLWRRKHGVFLLAVNCSKMVFPSSPTALA